MIGPDMVFEWLLGHVMAYAFIQLFSGVFSSYWLTSWSLVSGFSPYQREDLKQEDFSIFIRLHFCCQCCCLFLILFYYFGACNISGISNNDWMVVTGNCLYTMLYWNIWSSCQLFGLRELDFKHRSLRFFRNSIT